MKELGDINPLINIEEISATGGKLKKIITKTFYSKSTFIYLSLCWGGTMWEDKNSKITFPKNVTVITINDSSLLLYSLNFFIMLSPNEPGKMLMKIWVE